MLLSGSKSVVPRWGNAISMGTRVDVKGIGNTGKPITENVVPPERVELSSLAPEASTLSTELQGLSLQ